MLSRANKMVEMKGSSEGGVNFLSWRDWLLFIVALVLVVNVFWTLVIHFKMRALYIMLPAVPAALPRVAAASVFTPPPQFVFYLPIMPVSNQTTSTTYAEILCIFQLYSPTEVILVAALIVVVSTLLGLVVFNRLKCPSWRTGLVLEVGNNITSVKISICQLPHPANFYHFNVFFVIRCFCNYEVIFSLASLRSLVS